MSSILKSKFTETHTPKAGENGSVRINKIRYLPDQKLADGEMKTKIFEGFFGERRVAVKRVPEYLFTQADVESTLLLHADGHHNVIRYYATEKCDRYMYLALQLCIATLQDLIEGTDKEKEIDGFDVFQQALQGLDHLHSLRPPIVHKDLTPWNILVSKRDGRSEPRGILADLGLSKKFKDGRNSFTHTNDKGTGGWMAPELLNAILYGKIDAKPTLTLKIDIFAMGCILHYVCSQGKHPFGDNRVEQDYNITKGNLDEIKISTTHAYRKIIELMIHTNPEKRPAASKVLQHLAFDKSKHGMPNYPSK